ncbi:MAG TPA: BatD family protein [Myxococcales bacterium]|jgi:hypothetical protein
MLKRIGSALLFALLVSGKVSAAPAAQAADVELFASTDTNEVEVDGTLMLRIVANYLSRGDPGQLQLPAFSAFDVVSTSSQEQLSYQFASGAPAFRRTVTTTLALTPKREGDAVIEPAHLSWNGRTYATQPIRIKVLPVGRKPSARAQRQRQPNPDPFAGLGSMQTDPFGDVHPGQRDVLLVAQVDNERPFVGQQVTYSLYLLSRVNVGNVENSQQPKLDNFWAEDLEAPQQLTPQARILDGVPYQGYLLRKRALFPLRAGKAVIDPAEVQIQTGFGMLFSRGSVKRASQPITLDVQPLPPGKPPGFDQGNVGQWQLSASAEPLDPAVGSPVTLRIVVSGYGNVRDLRLPKPPKIDGLRAYDATTSDKEVVDKGLINGTRTIEQLLVPERTGVIQIPALAVDTFDPVQKQYKTLRTEPIDLRVGPSAAGAAAAAPLAQNLLASGGMRPIRLHLSEARLSAPPWSRPWFLPLLLLPPFGLAVLIGASRARRMLQTDPQQRRVRLARSAASKRLRGAQELLAKNDAAAFYAEIGRALTGYLADKQGIAAAGLTRDELLLALTGRGHPEETAKRLVRILDDCDRARFSPFASEAPAREAMLGRAETVLGELDRA